MDKYLPRESENHKSIVSPVVSAFCIGVGLTLLFLLGTPDEYPKEVTYSQFLTHFAQGAGFSLLSVGGVFLLRQQMAKRIPDIASVANILAVIIIAILIISYVVLRYFSSYQIALSILVSMTVVVIGWCIQSILSKKASRRQHTLNTILNTRISDIYQNHLKAYSSKISTDQHIHPTVARWFHYKSSDEFEGVCVSDDVRNAVNGIVYVINYFEFISLGIKQGDIDEDLFRECFRGMLPGIEKRAFHLIREAQSKNKEFFCAFVDLVDKWNEKNGGSLVKKYESHLDVEGLKELGEKFPCDATVDKCFNKPRNNGQQSKSSGSSKKGDKKKNKK